MTPGERALREGAAYVAVARAFWVLTGERPLAYLHDVLSQDVAGLGAGRGALAAALSSKGKVLAELRVLPLDEHNVLIDAEEAARAGVEEAVGRHAGLAGCELAGATDRYSLVALRGPGADASAGSAGIGLPGAGEAEFTSSHGLLAVRVVWGVAGIDVVGARASVERVAAASGATPATLEELEAARIEAGRPAFGIDVTDELLVNETPLLVHTVSFTKGCYPGQESVARVHNLGGVRRALRGLRGPGGVSPGATVVGEGVAVGTVTSAARLPEEGFAAIAILRSEIAPDSRVEVEGVTATVTALA